MDSQFSTADECRSMRCELVSDECGSVQVGIEQNRVGTSWDLKSEAVKEA